MGGKTRWGNGGLKQYGLEREKRPNSIFPIFGNKKIPCILEKRAKLFCQNEVGSDQCPSKGTAERRQKSFLSLFRKEPFSFPPWFIVEWASLGKLCERECGKRGFVRLLLCLWEMVHTLFSHPRSPLLQKSKTISGKNMKIPRKYDRRHCYL